MSKKATARSAISAERAMKLALGKIKSARDCPPNVVDTLLFEAEEILEIELAQQPAPVAKPHEQEPVAEVDDWRDSIFTRYVEYLPSGTRLYTTPLEPKPMTDEEIDNMCPKFEDPMRREMWMIGFKAAHGIKENT